MKKKRQKSKRERLIEKLDALHSKYIRKRDGQCVQCGSVQQLTWGHIFSKRHHVARWDMEDNGNVHTQCWPCNYRHIRQQYLYFKWYQDRFGMAQFEELYARWCKTRKVSDAEIQELIDDLLKQ